MNKLTLRPYQQEVVDEIMKSWGRKETPYANVMVGLGKTVIAAEIINRVMRKSKRILVLAPRKELVEQNFIEAFNYVDNPSDIGICCGQLGKYQINRQCVIAMPSSFVSRRTAAGFFDAIFADECHRWKIDGDDEKISTYNKIYKSLKRINPNIYVAGATGTGYRLDQGELFQESYKGKPVWTHKVYDTSVYPGIASLIADNYLSHIETLNTDVKVDLSGVRISGTDYNKDDIGVKFDKICADAVEAMREHFSRHDIDTAIIFASNLTNAKNILECWGDNSTMRLVHGGMGKVERENAIEWIKNGKGNRYIVNVDILAEGFNVKHLLCCVLFRATKSPGLLVQMVGRIIRPHDSKERSFLIDFGTNCERLGNIDNIIIPKPKMKGGGDMPMKLCGVPECCEPNILSAKVCIKCGAKFISVDESGLYQMVTREQALRAKLEDSTKTYPVTRIVYDVHTKDGSPDMIKMKFVDEDSKVIHSHYLMFNHKGFARDNSLRFFMRLFKRPSDYYKLGTAGITTESALLILQQHAEKFIKPITEVTLLPKGRFNEIKAITFIEEQEED